MHDLAKPTPVGGALASPLNAKRTHALDRLEAFLPCAGRSYAAMRNSDFGPDKRSNVSTLSPWIRHRLILEEEVVAAVLRRHSFGAAQKFLQEVFWRTYFKGWLEHRPHVWQRYCGEAQGFADELSRNSGLRSRYEAAVEGRTGIDCMDAWASELVETGYLHNHARMWFASIWIFTLQLPWQLGAEFFLKHLFDGDPASNTLSWRWVAGLHTKGKTYLARASNIEKFTNGRFNPEGQLSQDALPLEEADTGPPTALCPCEYVKAGEPFLLLVTKEDCCPERLTLPEKPRAVLGLVPNSKARLATVSRQVELFSLCAVEDAVDRSAFHFGVTSELREADEWADVLKLHARQAGAKTIVTAYTPVGPTRDQIQRARASLQQDGIQIVQVTRPYDAASWPHATKGFFALRKKIPHILSSLTPSD